MSSQGFPDAEFLPTHSTEASKIAMINGLVSDDPRQKAYWKSIPREGDIPTPEEFIAYTADVVRKMKIK